LHHSPGRRALASPSRCGYPWSVGACTTAIADGRGPGRAALVPAVCVAVVERAGRLGDDTKRQPGGIAQDPPGVHLLDPFGAKFFQPGDFRG
jgi:hypothetical protein